MHTSKTSHPPRLTPRTFLEPYGKPGASACAKARSESVKATGNKKVEGTIGRKGRMDGECRKEISAI